MRSVGPDDWREWRALRLEALGEAPAAFGSTLADWQGVGDSEERWRTRLSGAALNLLAEMAGAPAGMVSVIDAASSAVELISLWVAPDARGHGVGDALVCAVVEWSNARRKPISLSVREGNVHAIALYKRHGFVDAGPGETEAGAPSERRMVRLASRPRLGGGGWPT